jgi:hypothetical protein
MRLFVPRMLGCGSMSFTGAQGIPKYKIGLQRAKFVSLPPPFVQDAAGVLSLSSHQLGTVPLNRITLTYSEHHYVVATTKVRATTYQPESRASVMSLLVIL